MRLRKIKLAGFKSFVDPTSVPLPGDLVGIVGPNGCGKSNIIDAVRWVMGESSAKHLRGESMADVIFNGSNSRKPVGTAAIELIFDNADGSIGGQYASYNEISVKRQVNREGQSAYYLNGTRCRKRDITDVFLGTGLGPRSYSIIEQGMISRVIEARPEELRSYLEEAAGISLYKERRKETERRIRDTLENLDRLEDVRDEVGKQLDRLQRQAEMAERYKTLRNEERECRAQLLVLRLQGLEEQRERFQRELAERENTLQAEVAGQRGVEREAEEVRARHAEESDRLNDIQAQYYALGSDIARIEQQIAHRRERRETNERELERNGEAVHEVDEELAQDRDKLSALQARLSDLEPEVEEAREREEETRERVDAAEHAVDDWRTAWDRFNEAAAEPVRTAQVERTRIEQLERRSEELQRRRQRLDLEADGLRLDDAEAELVELTEQRDELAETCKRERAKAAEMVGLLDDRRERSEALATEVNELRGELHRQQARLTSLRTLQKAALGDDGPVSEWLDARSLGDAPRLVHRLDVESGWERAVETVLGGALQAVVAESLPVDDAAGDTLSRGEVTLLEAGAGDAPVVDTQHGSPRLSARARAPWSVADLFGPVYTADTLEEARRVAVDLTPDESVITRDGLWLGRRWLRVRGSEDAAAAGVVSRERDMTALESDIETAEARLESRESEQRSVQEALADAEEQRDDGAARLAAQERERSALDARIEARRGRIEEARGRRETLAAERDEIAETLAANDEDVHEARARLDEAVVAGERLDAERERLERDRRAVAERLEQARAVLDDHQARRHDLALKLESAGSARGSLEAAIQRLDAQRERLIGRRDELNRNLREEDGPDENLEERREELLEKRLVVEETLTGARTRLGEAEERMRSLETERADVEGRIAAVREAMESARFREYELKIRAQTQQEQLAELGFDRDTVAARLPSEASESDREAELERIEARINRLGAINLAAIDEYESLKERKGYLDSQQEDLTEALETLQTAIRRIDRETRQRFRETFDKVNEGIQRLFPRLFGGGHAYLELTGEDLLETGVSIMARPPGKKVSNIHLLSGGEKALTAVSLVFAIFELNPAPFCMLDEVDAPLDEANVGRFCDMVREMSGRVQFIMITHNKTTMEAATHLAGVTMNEPGVSRMVSVDVDVAAELAVL